jgi:uncharacterized protein (TIGR03083 family)
MLSKDRYLESFATDADALLDLAVAAPDAPVPHCGEWAVTDLVAHLCGVWSFLERHVRTRATERTGSMQPPDLTGAPLFAHARDVSAQLSSALAGVEPAESVWSWTADTTGGFYLRRAAQETAVHLWDVRAGLGHVEPLAADIAGDGIDELADTTFPNLLDRGLPEPVGSLHLHCTDTDGEWTLAVADGVVEVVRAHAKGDVAVKGSVSDLDLVLWERVPLDSGDLQVFGDHGVARSWTALTR